MRLTWFQLGVLENSTAASALSVSWSSASGWLKPFWLKPFWLKPFWLKFRSSPVPVLSGFYGTMAWAAWLRTASSLPHVVPRPGRLRVRFCTRAGANVCLGFVSPSSWTGPDLGTAKGRYGGSCRASFHWLLALRLARLYLGR